MRVKLVPALGRWWKIIIASIIFTQFITSCRRDDETRPIKQPDEVVQPDSLKSFTDQLSIIPLIFPNTVEGWGRSSGGYNKPSSIGWTHPSVLYFAQKWSNHKYWMAITPYPSGVNQFENPTIFCSDNGKEWNEPLGISNPIEKAPVEPGYNSDVNLFFENGKLYCFWRGVSIADPLTGRKIEGRSLLYRSSEDGVHWSEKQVITSWPYQGVDLIAPSVLKDADDYYCYAVSTGETRPGTYYTNYAIRRTVVKNINHIHVDKNTGYNLVNIPNRPWGEDEEPWHLEAKKFKDKWYILLSTTRNNQYGSGGRLFLGVSDDGINFRFGRQPLCAMTNAYKSSFELYEGKAMGTLNIKLWRSSSGDWSIFYDEFSLKGYFG